MTAHKYTVRRDITIAEYHERDAVSHSKLKLFEAAGAYGYRYPGAKSPQSDSQKLGQAFEDIFELDQAAWLAKYPVRPDGLDGRTKEGKAWKEANDDKSWLTSREYDAIQRMRDNLLAHPDASHIMGAATSQATIERNWRGVFLLQCRPDYWLDGQTADLKTTSDFAGFDREISKWRYHSQAGLIDVVTEESNPRDLIVVESVHPHRVQVVTLSAEWLDIGRTWCLEQLAKLEACHRSGDWPLCEPARVSYPPKYLQKGQ